MKSGTRFVLVLLAGVALALIAEAWSHRALEGRQKYEVYAIRYGTLTNFPVAELVTGADTSRRMDAAMSVWLLKGPGNRRVLVDAGYYRDSLLDTYTQGADYRKPSDAVAAAGVPPDSITDIIVSHVHWDHLDGVDLFPRATIWIQRAEYEYYVGPNGEKLHGDISPVDAAMLNRLKVGGRVHLVEGDDQEIIPGIRVYTGGRHTYASQYAGVNTRSGTVILASDNAYLYENLGKHIAIGTTFDAKANLAAQDRMHKLAARPELIVPGHDPAVYQRFPVLREGVVRID